MKIETFVKQMAGKEDDNFRKVAGYIFLLTTLFVLFLTTILSLLGLD